MDGTGHHTELTAPAAVSRPTCVIPMKVMFISVLLALVLVCTAGASAAPTDPAATIFDRDRPVLHGPDGERDRFFTAAPAGPGAGDPGYSFLMKWGADPGPGEFFMPGGVAFDDAGCIYVADTYNHRVQVFEADGTFIRVWGSYGTDIGEFMYPEDIAVDVTGAVYVVNTENHRVRKFTADGAFITSWGSYGNGTGGFVAPYAIAVSRTGQGVRRRHDEQPHPGLQRRRYAP